MEDIETKTNREQKIWRMLRPRLTETHQKVLRPRLSQLTAKDRAIKKGSREEVTGKVRIGQVGTGQIGTGQVRKGQVRTDQACTGQVIYWAS